MPIDEVRHGDGVERVDRFAMPVGVDPPQQPAVRERSHKHQIAHADRKLPIKFGELG